MSERVCPPWLGYLLASPLRRLIHNPQRILTPHVTSGMTVLDVGPAMGFFTLPLARMVGPAGRVVCVDVHAAMLRAQEQRDAKAGLAERIATRECGADSLGLADFAEQIDFALAFAVVHELPDAARFFVELYRLLKPGPAAPPSEPPPQGGGARAQTSVCLIAEPKLHVPAESFQATLAAAQAAGLTLVGQPKIRMCHTAVLRR